MAVTYSTAAKDAQLDALDTYAANAALLRIYDGTPPASANASLSSNTLLAELTMGSPPFGAASSGTLTAASITQDSSANATGTASFFRIYKADGTTVVAQGTVGTSGADLNLNTTAIVSGAAVSVTSLVITGGN
jgi:hypothetical protein